MRPPWPLLVLALGFAARAGKAPKPSPELIARGKGAYAIWCVACHGEAGAGDGATAHTLDPRPRNFSTGKFKQGSSARQIFDTLGKGVPGSAMVAFKNLPEDDRWALAWYVLELKAGRK
jgi:mono/diheme cytochrome c family protein